MSDGRRMAARVTLAPCVQARDVRSARSDPCILGTRARKYARRQGRARFPNRLDGGPLTRLRLFRFSVVHVSFDYLLA